MKYNEYSTYTRQHTHAKSDFKHVIGYRFLNGIWNIKI